MPQKTFFPICIISLLLIAFAITTHQTQAQPNLSQKFSGHILLQVEQNGEARYVNPVSL